MINRLRELLEREPFVILDGGLATELERDGSTLDDPLWSAKMLLEQPERVLAVHRRFVAAGADLITTASYQATIPGLLARGLDQAQARDLLRHSVALARSAASSNTLVAASIGSYGAYLADGSEYRGDYGIDRKALFAFHSPRVRVLSAAKPDLLAFETIPSALEAAAIADVLSANDGPRAWVSFSLRQGPGLAVSDGSPLPEAVAPLLGHPRIAAIGVNCVGPAEVLPAIDALVTLTANSPGISILAYPNSGERWIEQAWAGPQTELKVFTELARRWVDAGARMIGGCCRTGPDHIRALTQLRSRQIIPT
ncbi:Homocysteine S-methyltransferase [Enhygromyxa salina]|uniref:Homocysteine S-methyltransferase n=1 Tax=Enhygromyxa salina TaxID=215803 RepID=A0A0C1ZRE9_9BACT|nr:homocysteine S-methyltransferase [Enhygromyxa salina]KIG13583.1 Homocysteine S-methyltransferase [Enhygromyxa salina]